LADFYRKILKITLDENSDENKNEKNQFIITDGTGLTIAHKEETINGNGNICLAFTVDNVDKEYERLLGLGVIIKAPPTTRPWGAKNMLFYDPDGNKLIFRTILNDNI
jgi:predicted enzyme related to lactoylglutathione lyase